jgi:hypothetical protein
MEGRGAGGTGGTGGEGTRLTEGREGQLQSSSRYLLADNRIIIQALFFGGSRDDPFGINQNRPELNPYLDIQQTILGNPKQFIVRIFTNGFCLIPTSREPHLIQATLHLPIRDPEAMFKVSGVRTMTSSPTRGFITTGSIQTRFGTRLGFSTPGLSWVTNKGAGEHTSEATVIKVPSAKTHKMADSHNG